jgi:hypothetical protein
MEHIHKKIERLEDAILTKDLSLEKLKRENASLKHVNQGLYNIIEGLQQTNKRLLGVNAEYKSQAIRYSNLLDQVQEVGDGVLSQVREMVDDNCYCKDWDKEMCSYCGIEDTIKRFVGRSEGDGTQNTHPPRIRKETWPWI